MKMYRNIQGQGTTKDKKEKKYEKAEYFGSVGCMYTAFGMRFSETGE